MYLSEATSVQCTHVDFVWMLRAIDGFARSIDCTAPSMDPLIAHLSIDRTTIDRSRNHRSIAHYCACAVDGRICARALV